MYILQFWVVITYYLLVGSNSQLITIKQNPLLCRRDFHNRTLLYTCPVGSILKDFDFDGLEDLNSFEKLHVIGINSRGPLTSIPKNICRLKKLKYLDLSNNQIKNAFFDYDSSCLSQLEILDLSYNYLRKIPDRWISQMPYLKSINLSNNKLTCLPNTMFFNISNLDKLDVSSNNIISFELWLIEIKQLINYSNNPVTHFTNDYNVDLSNYQTNITTQILLNNIEIKIDLDDSIFPMYNRCKEINSIDDNNNKKKMNYLMQAIGIIHRTNPGILRLNCSCKQYYLQKYIISIMDNIDFSQWNCGNSNETFYKMCSDQSSFDFMNVEPRFCKVNQLEEGIVPIYRKSGLCNSINDLESISLKISEKLNKINFLDETNTQKFIDIIDESNDELNSFISPINSNSIENIFQNIISQIEYLLESINTTINMTSNSVAILSVFKNSSIYSFNYSNDINPENSIATITIDQTSIEYLNPIDIYIFYYLPSIFFQFAQNNQNIIIISPIIGIHLSRTIPHIIQMSFIDIERQNGIYSCVFWQRNQWNNSGCLYSKDLKTNHHWCTCNHTTSFALIFIPHKIIEKTYIPSIIVALISILCFFLSIILSICRQTTNFHHLSITNIFTLSNSIVLFSLLTVILIRGYQSNIKIFNNCSISEENLVLTTYFFLLTTFLSKTLLGIHYFLTIFSHFIFIQLTIITNKWFYGSFFLVLFLALIPIIIIKILFKEWKNFFVQYQGICWFNSSEIFRFISIPIICLISLNILIIFGITIRLIQYLIARKTIKTNEKRVMISIMIWIALCISLGIAWIFGPFLNILIRDNQETSAVIQLWIFGIFIGLEGVWVLIVNVIFYFTQKANMKNRQMTKAVYQRLEMYNNKNDVITVDQKFFCIRKYNLTWMEFICPSKLLFEDILLIDDLNSIVLKSIESLTIKGIYNIKGPLNTIPSNICRFIELKRLYFYSNKIKNIDFNFTTPCLSQLRTLDLSYNFISNISIQWINQMPLLEYVYLQSNNLTNLPYNTFNNISHLRILNISRNYLSTIELWTVQIQEKIDYQSNRIHGFSNQYNVDLSHLQIQELPRFYIDKNLKLRFDDTIFEMYNRCVEVHNISKAILTRAILSIIENTNYLQTFYKNCSCDKFYFYRTAFAIKKYQNSHSFENWICLDYSIPFIQQCNNRSSANFSEVVPRLCKIDDSETGTIPVYVSDPKPIPITSTTTIEPTATTSLNISMTLDEIEKYLENISILNNYTIENFIHIINIASTSQNITHNSNISEEIRKVYQKIIRHIENLIESVNSTLNNSEATVALVSTTKTNPFYYFNQLVYSNSSVIYSHESEHNHSVASISIDQKHINYLSDDNVYSFFFLPSSLFHYAQIDSRIEVVSSIVGAHLPIQQQSFNVQMSFHNNNSTRSSGYYSCVFWQVDRWNDTGCIYSTNPTTNRHYCHCSHLTSFALIFTPYGVLRQTFLPTIITSCFSIIGLCISIILSLYQQTKSSSSSSIHRSRRFPSINIISLSSTLILFILFTSLLITNYQSSSTTTHRTTSTFCQSSKLNLVLATYFFIILTFVTKTLVGIYFYCTTFIQIKLRLFVNRPDQWYFLSLFTIMMIALIPTIIASILSHQGNNVIVSKNNSCWFDGIYLTNFVTIPISILIGINVIIVIFISIRLFQFLCNANVSQGKEKRLIIATCMWIASCVLLGIIWIVGPLLNLFINNAGESSSISSKIIQWIFALLVGLEGIWVLSVNILFYVRQQPKTQSRWAYSPKDKRKWYRIADLRTVSNDMHDKQKETNDDSSFKKIKNQLFKSFMT